MCVLQDLTPSVLCDLSDIPDGEGREFLMDQSGKQIRVLVVRRENSVYGYENLCPHNYIPLNDQPDRFVTYDHAWIICSAHGAVFRYEDGYCEDGPCKGRSLAPVAIQVQAGKIVV